jgi:hypothetical protein
MLTNNWEWHPGVFENVEGPHVKAARSRGSWSVTAKEKDFAWGYCVNIPADARSFIMWHARVKVLKASVGVWPGIALHDTKSGVLFLVNGAGTAELRFLKVGREAVCSEFFDLHDVPERYTLSLDYNAVTSVCSGRVSDKTVFSFSLPRGIIPAIGEVAAVEIVTTTPPEESGGTATYGTLTLDCE